MRRLPVLLATLVAVFVASAAAQNYQPRSIQFKGAPDFSDQELLTAAALRPGISLSVDAMKDHAKLLLDTGVFDNITFQFTGVDLRYLLTPSAALLPIRLANLPLASDKDLDAELHDKAPLYHGKVPADSGLTEQVRIALEQILAAQGIKATVEAVATAGTAPGKGEVLYSITAPPVLLGEMYLDSKSPALEPQARELLNKLANTPYDLDGTPSQISTYLGNYYRDKGYIEAAITATPANPAAASAGAIRIPFQISFVPGIQYKLAQVRLAPDLVVAQADFDHQANIHPGDIADGQRVLQNWEFLSRQYHNHGYMQARIHPTPTFDRAKGTVTFDVTTDAGPVYTMGVLTIENVSEDLRAAMLAAWKMPAGATFNEGAIRGFFATQGVNPALERVFAAINVSYSLHLNDEARTVDVALRLEKKR